MVSLCFEASKLWNKLLGIGWGLVADDVPAEAQRWRIVMPQQCDGLDIVGGNLLLLARNRRKW